MADDINLTDLKVAISNIADLLGHVTEGVARTGAFDQAGNIQLVSDAVHRVAYSLDALGYEQPNAALRSALERIENKVHIKRLFPS